MNRPLARLVACAGLLMVNNVTFIAINGLVGLALAPVGWMATLPVTGYVAGGALATALVARHQQRWGRQRTFRLGLVVAALSALACALAAWTRSFWLLNLATLAAGYYNANGALYRFAATELVAPEARERAISAVLAGGIVGAIGGPWLATNARGWIDAAPFAGAYLALAAVALVGWALMGRIDFPALPGQGSAAPPGRPLGEIVRRPRFVVAAGACAIGYGVMNLLMAATPIAMQQCGHSFGASATVLMWHVLAMYVPSFFTGRLIQRVGVAPVLVAGVLLNAACVALALAGTDVAHFTAALVALGVGWNFLYLGGTTLTTRTLAPDEKTRGQAAVDFAVYATMTVTSFSSGALVTTGGWQAMNLGALLPLALLAIGLLALGRTAGARAS